MRMKRKLPETKKEEGQKTFQREWNKIYKQVDELRQKKNWENKSNQPKTICPRRLLETREKEKKNQQKMTPKKFICSF